MADFLLPLGSAIYSQLSSGTLAVYDTLAVQNSSTPPYCIYALQDARITHPFSDSGQFVSSDVVVKVLSNRIWAHEATQAYAGIHTLMEGAALSISGYSLLRNQRVSVIRFKDPDGYWHIGGLYRVEFDS